MCTAFLFAGTLSNGKVFGLLTSGVFPHDRHSPGRDTTAQACRFSCFFCAAYGLLLTQTRTQCSNSASRAIAMLEKSAKISPNACAVVSLPGKHDHAENSCLFLYFAIFSCLINNTKFCGCFAHVAPVKATAIHVEQPICTEPSPSGIKVQVCLLVPADLWQIFAGLASRAIALKTLFERRARVCLKSNP